jgi:hypothetical protein
MTKAGMSVLVPLAALLALGTVSFMQIARNAPAFSPSLRSESVWGDWRVPLSRSLYDQGEYHLQLGYGFLRGDALDLLAGGTDLPSLEVFEARVSRARELFEMSVASSPGQADAWTGLAWTNVILGDRDEAWQMLRVSWQLAPLSLAEATERLGVVSILLDNETSPWPDETTRRLASDDLRMLLRFDRTSLEDLVLDTPDFMKIIEGVDDAN